MRQLELFVEWSHNLSNHVDGFLSIHTRTYWNGQKESWSMEGSEYATAKAYTIKEHGKSIQRVRELQPRHGSKGGNTGDESKRGRPFRQDR